MGISIAICEKDAPNAPCAKLKKDIKKVLVSDVAPFGDAAEYDEKISLESAKALFPDFGAFMKRNRINEESNVIYLEKIKKDDDIAILKPKAVKEYTGWVVTEKLDVAGYEKAISLSKPENRLTSWDMLEFDDVNATCASCPLSWDKGRGCIGAFGPDNSLLPEIAQRRGCPIVASVPDAVKSAKVFSSDDAKKLAEEVKLLQEILPEEGKMMVRRYSGPLERLAAVAEISVKEGCGFYFF